MAHWEVQTAGEKRLLVILVTTVNHPPSLLFPSPSSRSSHHPTPPHLPLTPPPTPPPYLTQPPSPTLTGTGLLQDNDLSDLSLPAKPPLSTSSTGGGGNGKQDPSAIAKAKRGTGTTIMEYSGLKAYQMVSGELTVRSDISRTLLFVHYFSYEKILSYISCISVYTSNTCDYHPSSRHLS